MLRCSAPIAVGLFEEELARAAALLDEVRAHEAGVERFVLRGDEPVHQNDGDAGGLGLGEHGVPAVLHDGREGNHVHPVGDEGADGVDLLFLFLIGVEHHQAARRARSAASSMLQRAAHAPGAFRSQLGKAQQHGRGGGSGGGLGVFIGRAGAQQRRAKQQRQQSFQVFHVDQLPEGARMVFCKVYHFFRNLSIDRRRKDKSAPRLRGTAGRGGSRSGERSGRA